MININALNVFDLLCHEEHVGLGNCNALFKLGRQSSQILLHNFISSWPWILYVFGNLLYI